MAIQLTMRANPETECIDRCFKHNSQSRWGFYGPVAHYIYLVSIAWRTWRIQLTLNMWKSSSAFTKEGTGRTCAPMVDLRMGYQGRGIGRSSIHPGIAYKEEYCPLQWFVAVSNGHWYVGIMDSHQTKKQLQPRSNSNHLAWKARRNLLQKDQNEVNPVPAQVDRSLASGRDHDHVAPHFWIISKYWVWWGIECVGWRSALSRQRIWTEQLSIELRY